MKLRRGTVPTLTLLALAVLGCPHLEPLSEASSHVGAAVGDRCSWEVRHEDGSCDVYAVTLGELLAVPEKFHGKPVRVAGFVTLKFEGNTICENNTPAAGCLWLDVEGLSDPGFRK